METVTYFTDNTSIFLYSNYTSSAPAGKEVSMVKRAIRIPRIGAWRLHNRNRYPGTYRRGISRIEWPRRSKFR